MQKKSTFRCRLKPLAAALLFGAGAAGAADNLPDMGAKKGGEEWKVDVFYENDTHHRERVGLSKFRNTLQVEADKSLGASGPFASVKFRSKLRATYDGVYAMNESEYGKKAGGPILLQTGDPGLQAVAPFLPPALGVPPLVPQGSGIITHSSVAGLAGPLGAPFLAGNAFVDGYPTAQGAINGNDGLRVLGDRLHVQGGGVAFGVPVRPCNVDSRGCIKDYMDAKQSELESPEFNDRMDFIREAFVVANMPLADGRSMVFQVGKQQVVWGRTDLFRVLDVINPVDYSRNNIYDELQDIRIPMWIATAEYRMGATETFDDTNLQLVWNFDKFRPNNLGQGGTPNEILDAGNFFRGMKNLWDNGGTVANFALASPTMPGYATNFGPGQIGIRQANLPSWSLENTQLGIKWEGVYKGTGFSLNALSYRSQLPSLRSLYGKGVQTVNGFTGQLQPSPYIIAFDIDFPRVNLVGGSMDIQAESIASTFRLETALTHGEEFANTSRPEMYSKSRVWRYVIGWDRPTFIPFLNDNRTFLLSAQLFGQHLLDHEQQDGPWGKIGMPDWEHNHIMTFLIKGWYQNDRISPQIITAHDFKAHSSVVAPAVEWLPSDKLKITIGANYKFGDGAQQYSDARDINPWAPFTGLQGLPGGSVRPGGPVGSNMPLGLTGFEPLGRFRAGPIGMANKENEIFVTVRYKF